MRLLILIFVVSFLLPLQNAFASAAIQARQRALQQRQQQTLRQQQQRIIQQQQQAYRQAVLQRQSQVQRQAQQQAVNQAVNARAAQQKAYNQAASQNVANIVQQNQRAAMSAQQQIASRMAAEQQAYKQAMARTGVLMSNQMPQMPYAPLMPQQQLSIPGVQGHAYGDLFYTPPVAEVVNITDIWEQMEKNSHTWNIMIDMEPKILTVQRMVDHYNGQGIQINKSPMHYVQLIDSMAFQNPDMLNQSFETIMKVVAIIEYDFDNGQNKDALARQIFPEDSQFQANKQRLGY